ncbi:trypsin-like serine protease [uncultured Vibrio sp.]|uniref:trypsin-like serine protease n=1 Tax=uncultured Vibrio sp. TaxID=114054 RepID=UPI0025E50E50|nr:trypsin-like serine protease [uncultured Vibrio sp.]
MNRNRIWLSSLLVSCISFSFNVNASGVSAYIVNGSDVSASKLDSYYTNFASLFYDNGSAYGNYCGATMIDTQHILTAAHCIYDDFDGMLNFYVAPRLDNESDYLSAGVVKARVERYYYPDNYSDSSSDLWANDIAILKLESALNVSVTSGLINTTENDTYNINAGPESGYETFMTIGHGLVEGNASGSNTLQQTDLTIKYPKTTCGSAMTSKQLCFDGAVSGSYKNSTCNGDSGGPVYWYDGGKYVQIGITSFGPTKCGDTSITYTSAFTEVFDYQAWINSVTNGAETPKYYVATINGIRTLFDGSGRVVGTDGVSTGDSDGGAFGWLTLFAMSLLLGARRKLSPLRVNE